MCGIFAFAGEELNSPELVLNGLKNLEYRGYDSWGVAVVPEEQHKIEIKKKVGKIGDNTVKELPKGKIAFGHTRWATHGGVTDENAHPHLSCDGRIAVVHNGIFENYELIKASLIKKGDSFFSETDSEVIVHLIEEYMKKQSFFDSIRRVFKEMEGLNAFIAIHAEEDQVIAARNGSPLVIGLGENTNYLASDPAALLPYTKKVYFMEDNEIAVITREKIEVLETASGQIKKINFQELDWEISQIDKGKFPYFMLKEIHEQPQMLNNIALNSMQKVEDVANFIKKYNNVYFIGCGTASHACHVAYYLFATISKKHINWSVGSEFSYDMHDLSEKSVVVALSQSGETMDLLEPLKASRTKNAHIVALVNVLGSSLYRMADKKILLSAGPEKAVASTKAFTAKVAHLILLAYAMVGKYDEGKKVLLQAVEVSKKVLKKENVAQIEKLATNFSSIEHIYCLGRGVSYPLSTEAALKIKEISYIHAEGLASGELKHGTLALIEKGTPCIVFLPDDETYNANLSSAMEVKARGGIIIGVSQKPHTIFDYFIEVEDAHEATIIPNVIVAQLLAYFLTIKRGLDPDMPRNLAKSVTVK